MMAPLLVAGCSKRIPAGPTLDQQLLSQELAERDQLLRLFNKYPVSSKAIFTTPAPKTSVTETVPFLRGLKKTTTRLHPRVSDNPPVDDSKLGGTFLWPESEPTPSDATGVALVPVLQLRSEHCPPQVSFPDKTNLLQLFWNAAATRVEELNPKVVWRNRAEVTNPRQTPWTVMGYPSNMPVSCRLFPEQVDEFPPLSLLPERILDTVKAIPDYDSQLATCPGTKVGGYPFGISRETITSCAKCKRPTDFLLGIAPEEWTPENRIRWMSKEEQALANIAEVEPACRAACGLKHRVNLFVCRRCEGWPVQIVT
jgi:hypothetical protein